LLLIYVPRATLYWVLLLVYVGPRATHFTGIVDLCAASSNTLMGIVVGLCGVLLFAMLHLGQHTLLSIVVGL
jgi:hypothetical protein